MDYRDLVNVNPDKIGEFARAVQEAMGIRRKGLSKATGKKPTTAKDLLNLATATPVVGDAIGLGMDAHQYATNPEARNMLNYAITAASAVPFVPSASQAKQVIKAYHGSPHDFDKFSMDAIGTGEGAQAYGHGLYFAESEDVAKQYRDILSGNNNRDFVDLGDDEFFRVARELESAVGAELPEPYLNESGRQWVRRMIERNKDSLSAEQFSYFEGAASPAGSMYQVEIDASPDEFLDWDKPLSEQSEVVQRVMDGLDEEKSLLGMTHPSVRDKYKGEDLYDALSRGKGQEIHVSNSTGRGVVSAPSAADGLSSRGIKGIRYKDGFSRGAEGGTSNYVVFDENLITISKKYGVAIPVAAAMLYGQDKADQGYKPA